MTFLLTLLACGLFVIYGALIVSYQRAWNAIPVDVPGSMKAGASVNASGAVDAVPSVDLLASLNASGAVDALASMDLPASVNASGAVDALASMDPAPSVDAAAADAPASVDAAPSADTAAADAPASVDAAAMTAVAAMNDAVTRISVLIPARNEEKNIADCLRSLALQTYPKDLFEVIVLDDHSTDGTAAAVRGFSGGGLHVSCLRMADIAQPAVVSAHKKFAIEMGVHASRGELIVTTDADCTFQTGWLSALAACYEQKGAQFIAAPVRIVARNRSLLSIFQILDFLTLQGITGAAVYKGLHSMCNGANLAYSKGAFYAVGGYTDIDHIPSGDDMFLMHKIWLRYPSKTFFLKSREAIVSTAAEMTWKRFVNQRIRWASKADRYDDKRIFWVLLLVYFLNVMFVLLPLGAIWNFWWLWLFLILLLVKTFVEYPFVRSVAVFFGQGDLMVYFAPLQPLHICYTVVIGWLGKFGSYQWKDRKISK